MDYLEKYFVKLILTWTVSLRSAPVGRLCRFVTRQQFALELPWISLQQYEGASGPGLIADPFFLDQTDCNIKHQTFALMIPLNTKYGFLENPMC